MSTTYWWLSFVDPTKPAGQASLGVCVVPVIKMGGDVGDASTAAWRAGCNPGGEVAGWQLSRRPPDWFPLNTLISREQVSSLQEQYGSGGRATAAGEEEQTPSGPSPTTRE